MHRLQFDGRERETSQLQEEQYDTMEVRGDLGIVENEFQQARGLDRVCNDAQVPSGYVF